MANTKRKDNKNRILQKGESQRADGTYSYRYTYNGVRKYIYDKNLNSLREKAKKIQKDIENGININYSSRTLNEQFELLLSLKNVRDTTMYVYKHCWLKNVKDTLGNKTIESIKKSDIMRLIAEKKSEGLSKACIGMINMLISECMQLAVDDDILYKNPCVGCMKSIENDKKTKIPLTYEEQNNLLWYIENNNYYRRYYPMLTFMLETALRCGEVCGLTWNDVDFESRTVNINHQLVYIHNKGNCNLAIHQPKTKNGVRVIPLTEKAVNSLLLQRRMQFERGKRTTVTIDGYSDFVFSTNRQTPFEPPTLNQMLEDIVKSYNRDNDDTQLPHITPHLIRHTACTNMALSGMNVKSLQYIMGHSSLEMTLNVYSHSTFENVKSEVEKWEKYKKIV